MSDPMSNVEIEDVLSSIRRLVSENATRPRPAAAPDPEPDLEDEPDALVLTPSLRVGEAAEAGEEPADEAAGPAGPEDEAPDAGAETALDASWAELAGSEAGQSRAADVADDALLSRVAELESAFDDGDSFEPDGSEVAAPEEAYDWDDDATEDAVIDLSTPDVPSGRLHFTRITPEADDVAATEEEPALAEADWDETAEIEVEEEPAAEESWPEPEEDWTAPELPTPEENDAGATVTPLVFRSSHRGAAAAQPVEDAEEIAPEPDPEPEPEEVLEREALAEQDAALEGYVIGTEARDAASDEDDHDPWHDDEDDDTSVAAFAAEGAPAAIDEARLADLVAEVVRAELRGRMGERITQNVRKLVRREIARALETRGIR
ncbi:hypothetical protein [Vannielia litorea]|uniref:Uncharacterized protein n=1 Tax=Vannielia litorea TaxID=1217970 RepID=A0A1N6GAM7_9RHOB|nr:hypothetical protein [Vannielia litorea]SIO04482.1 hypothetical protein SAMN05444002_2329 [Vannielia litorea]